MDMLQYQIVFFVGATCMKIKQSNGTTPSICVRDIVNQKRGVIQWTTSIKF